MPKSLNSFGSITNLVSNNQKGCFVLGIIFSIYIENIRQFISNLFNITLFPEEIYFLSTMPYELDFKSILLISICSIISTCLVSLFPAIKASNLDTIKSLKYE